MLNKYSKKVFLKYHHHRLPVSKGNYSPTLSGWFVAHGKIYPSELHLFCNILHAFEFILTAFRLLQHFENLVVRHFHERERVILDACGAYSSGMVVGSSVVDGAKYASDKWFVSFKKSLDAHTELLAKELAANRTRALELERDASAEDEIVSTS
jgi:hypothetical protein